MNRMHQLSTVCIELKARCVNITNIYSGFERAKSCHLCFTLSTFSFIPFYTVRLQNMRFVCYSCVIFYHYFFIRTSLSWVPLYADDTYAF